MIRKIKRFLVVLLIVWFGLLLYNHQYLEVLRTPATIGEMIVEDTSVAISAFVKSEADKISELLHKDEIDNVIIEPTELIEPTVSNKVEVEMIEVKNSSASYLRTPSDFRGKDGNNDIIPIISQPGTPEREIASQLSRFGFTEKSYGHSILRGLPLSASSPARYLIVAILSEECKPQSLAVFLGSIKEAVNEAKILLFVTGKQVEDKLIRRILTHYEIDVVLYKLHQHSNHLSEHQLSLLTRLHPNSRRWILLRNYLRIRAASWRETYRYIMLADIETIAVTGNPFAFYEEKFSGNKFLAFATTALGSQPAVELAMCFGSKLSEALQTSPNLYSALVMGTWDGVLTVAERIVKFLVEPSDLASNIEACMSSSTDQAILSVLLHLGFIQDVPMHTEESFPVVHLPNSMTAATATNGVLNLPVIQNVHWHDPVGFTTMPATVIHEYDRFSALTLTLYRKHVFWVDYGDNVDLWRGDPSCSKYTVWTGSDILAGKCDLDSASVTSANECCALCNDYSKKRANNQAMLASDVQRFGSSGLNMVTQALECTSFAFAHGNCYFKSCDRSFVKANATALASETVRRSVDWSIRGDRNLKNSDVDIVLTAYY